MTSFEFGENRFVVWLAGCHNVIEDAREFVARILDCLDCTEASTLPTIEVAEERFGIVKRRTCYRKNRSDAIFRFVLRATNLPSGTGSVFGTEVQPGCVGKSDRSAPNSLKMV